MVKLYYRVDDKGIPWDNFCSDAAIGAVESGDTTHSTLKREVQALLGKAAKEAVVQAINKFLIWYNENSNTNR